MMTKKTTNDSWTGIISILYTIIFFVHVFVLIAHETNIIIDIATHLTFEETVFLLMFGAIGILSASLVWPLIDILAFFIWCIARLMG